MRDVSGNRLTVTVQAVSADVAASYVQVCAGNFFNGLRQLGALEQVQKSSDSGRGLH